MATTKEARALPMTLSSAKSKATAHHTNNPRPGFVDYALLLALAAIWGAAFMLVKVGVSSIASWTLTALRLCIAAVFMVIWAALKTEAFPRAAGFWRLALVTALFGNVMPFMLITWGQEQIDSGIAAICMATMPLMTLLMAHVTLPDDRLTGPKLIGVSCGLAGLIILIGPLQLTAVVGTDTMRLLAVAAAALCYAINAICTRKWLRSEPRYALAAATMILAVAIIVPFALWIDRPWQLLGSGEGAMPSTQSLAAVVVLGVLQTSVAQIMLFKLIARQGPSFFSQVNYFVPVFGVFWGWMVLSEQLPAQAFVALAVILSGLAIVRLWGSNPSPSIAKLATAQAYNPKADSRKKRRKQKHLRRR
jgi:drug/metabolite transporter (DMT)-like permease